MVLLKRDIIGATFNDIEQWDISLPYLFRFASALLGTLLY